MPLLASDRFRAKARKAFGASRTAKPKHAPRTSRILVDYENNAVAWWDAARLAPGCPAALRPILHGNRKLVKVTKAEADACEAWCAQLPGWDSGPEHAGNALIFADRA